MGLDREIIIMAAAEDFSKVVMATSRSIEAQPSALRIEGWNWNRAEHRHRHHPNPRLGSGHIQPQLRRPSDRETTDGLAGRPLRQRAGHAVDCCCFSVMVTDHTDGSVSDGAAHRGLMKDRSPARYRLLNH